MSIEEIEKKHEKLITIAKDYMDIIEDPSHNKYHVIDVVDNIKLLMEKLPEEFDREVVVIAGYWHDVGRTKLNAGHELLSAQMLKSEMEKLGYNEDFINKCYEAVPYHKWNMTPKTIEGYILKDADKLAYIGLGRWQESMKAGLSLDSIIDMLPRLRNEILYFEESRLIYDKQIVDFAALLYKEAYLKQKANKNSRK